MTDHPCKGLSKAAVIAFEKVAVDQEPRAARSTLAMLVRRGLLTPHQQCDRNGDFGVFTWTSYTVPTNIHMQWCKWCHENVTDAEIGREAGGRAADL